MMKTPLFLGKADSSLPTKDGVSIWSRKTRPQQTVKKALLWF
jgi:hypothetical protein